MGRKRIRDIRNEEFIEATIRVVHARGFANVTMADIATEAGSTAASISYYFGSKEKLLEATMRHLLSQLKTAMLERFDQADTPRERLQAVIDANFDDRLFTVEICSVWIQFWAFAPYSETLARLHRINRARVQSHFRAELGRILPTSRRETVRETLQAYMDGIWLETSQSATPANADEMRVEAKRVVGLLLQNSNSWKL